MEYLTPEETAKYLKLSFGSSQKLLMFEEKFSILNGTYTNQKS